MGVISSGSAPGFQNGSSGSAFSPQSGSLQAMGASRGWVQAGDGAFRGKLKDSITLPRRAANAYGSTDGSLQAMGVSRGWVQAGDGRLQRKA